jgi:hypothetical protein
MMAMVALVKPHPGQWKPKQVSHKHGMQMSIVVVARSIMEKIM